MTNNIDQFEHDNAKEALDSSRKFERIGLERGIAPPWFGITLAVVGGVVITLAGLDASRLYVMPLSAFMFVLVLHQILKADVIVKPLLSGRAVLALAVGVVVIFLPLILIAQENSETFGAWVAIFSGIGFTIFMLIASRIERLKYLARIDAEKC